MCRGRLICRRDSAMLKFVVWLADIAALHATLFTVLVMHGILSHVCAIMKDAFSRLLVARIATSTFENGEGGWTGVPRPSQSTPSGAGNRCFHSSDLAKPFDFELPFLAL